MRSPLLRFKWQIAILFTILSLSAIIIILWAHYRHPDNGKLSREERLYALERGRALQERLAHPPAPPVSRYELLDQTIALYLSALQSNQKAASLSTIATAKQIADELAAKTGDQFGHHLVAYYRNVPRDAVEPLIAARKIRAELEAEKGTELYKENLLKAEQAKAIFDKYNADCDNESLSYYLIKYLSRTGAPQKALQLTNAGITVAAQSRHIFSHARFLHRKGDTLSGIAELPSAMDALQQSIKIATPLDVPRFIIQPTTALALIYYVKNDNERALEHAFNAFKIGMENNILGQMNEIQLAQVLGISSFNLELQGVAEAYLQAAISRSQKYQSPYMLALSYTFMGIVRAEQSRHADANACFTAVFQTLATMPDMAARTQLEFSTTAYYARAQMLAGNVSQAIDLYAHALELGKTVNTPDNLSFSQIHQGLGECYLAQGDRQKAKEEMATAVALYRKARENTEENNLLLTYAVTRKSPEEQLRLINTP